MSVVSTNFTRYQISTATSQSDLYGGISTITQVFKITKNNLSYTNFIGNDYRLLVTEGMAPNVGSLITTYFTSGTGAGSALSGDTWQYFCRCRSVDFEQLESYAIKMTVVWSTMYSMDPATLVSAPNGALPSNIEFNSGLRQMEMFRRTGYSAPPSTADISTADIGGTYVGTNGNSFIIDVPQVRMRMRFTQDASVASMGSAQSILTNYVGLINSAVFVGMPVGTCICESVSMVRLDAEFYEVVFDFLFDKFYFHSQVPEMGVDNLPKMNGTGTDYNRVDWMRQARSSVDFNLIYGAAGPDATLLKAVTERGYWPDVTW
jgi:hypothetical protein